MQAKEDFYGRANDFEQITNITSPSSLRRTHVVTHHELWYRYVTESGNWHGGTLTRWMAALSAAPLSLISSAVETSYEKQSLFLGYGTSPVSIPCQCQWCGSQRRHRQREQSGRQYNRG
jgi:hypothetical protein